LKTQLIITLSEGIILGSNILISGLTGTGKTSLSSYLSQKFGYGYISGSDIRNEYHNLTKGDRNLWLNDEKHIWVDNKRIEDVTLENFIDEKLEFLNMTKQKHVFDVWFLPWYTKISSFKILILAPLDTRANRLQKSVRICHNLQSSIHQKDIRSYQYALKKYNVDIIGDTSPFDIVLVNDDYSESVFLERACEEISKMINKNEN